MLFLVFRLASSGHAASINKSTSSGCAVELVGDIQEGDAAHAKELLQNLNLLARSDVDVWDTDTNKALCLNSSGGLYFEGMKIARLVHDGAVTTRILQNSKCSSACAIIFMAGRATSVDDDSPSRYLNVSGQLGFHAPYPKLDPSKTYSAEEVEKLIQMQSLIASSFLEFASFHSEFDFKTALPMSLVREMFNSGPDNLAFVDDVDRAARWGIGMEGITLPSNLSVQQITQLCRNMEAWSADRSGIEKAEPSSTNAAPTLQVLKTNDGSKKFWFVDTGGMESQNCLIQKDPQFAGLQEICIHDDFSGRHLGDCLGNVPYLVPTWFALSPDTKLNSLTSN